MSSRPRPIDPVDPAHLTGASAPPPPIHRYAPSAHLLGLVRRYWVPVWRLPPGDVQVQKVLQHPVCVAVISDTYARFSGVVTGLSTVELVGEGWAVGIMFQPAAGRLLWGASVSQLTETHVDVCAVPGLARAELPTRVRTVMVDRPSDPSLHLRAIGVVEEALARHVPRDATLRLKRGATRLGEVAHELGYTDQAHFTRDFSRVTGMPPGAYLADQ
jgi:hypothetical protein